jgi:lysophospholipase L1-like esterase
LGDSLTKGVGAQMGEDYPSVLADRLGRPIVNAGHPGNTTADALMRLQEVLNQNPRLVIVFLGGNDFLRQVPLQETQRNLEEMIGRIQNHGAMVAIVGMKLGLFTDEYGPLFESIAERLGALYIPQLLNGILTDSKLKSDAIHPNAAGYRLMAERMAKQIKPLLESADRRRGGAGPG